MIGQNTKKFFKILFPILILCAFVVIGIFYFYIYKSRVSVGSYIIEGVPYYGTHHRFNETLETPSTLAAAVAAVLGYWGDERYSWENLENIFSPLKFHSFEDIKFFFRSAGYNTSSYSWSSTKTPISRIKSFVNIERNIPVIVYQRFPDLPGSQNVPYGVYRVVVGFSDKEQKLTVHDYYFGANYEISYADFEKMFEMGKWFMLFAVRPSSNLRAQLVKTPVPALAKPEVKNNAATLFLKRDIAYSFAKKNDYKKAIEIQESIINDPVFDSLHPAYKVFFTTILGKYLVMDGRPDDAISTINSRALPLNQNLNAQYEGWAGFTSSSGKLYLPYWWLAKAYLAKGDKQSAINNFEEVLKVNPTHEEAKQELEALKK